MIRSMYSGVSGLKTMQIKMDVIGNNIANVNTAGFKKSRVSFKDSLYQVMQGASAPSDDRGGTNAMAIGLGMGLGSVDQIHTPAPAATTNKETDMAIDGNGYFIIKNNKGETLYTRAGSFSFDKLGNLVTAEGYSVQGWVADEDNQISTSSANIQDINIGNFRMTAPRSTTEVIFSGNLDSTLDEHDVANDPFDIDTDVPDSDNAVITSKEVYDSLGNGATVYFRFFKVVDDATASAPDVQWYCDISLDPDFPADTSGNFDVGGTSPTGSTTVRIGDIRFTSEGDIDTSTGNTTSIDLSIDRTAFGADPIDLSIDLSQISQFNSPSTAWAEHQDGCSAGVLTSFNIGSDGVIRGVYDNGELRDLARVALADFQNPAGLAQVGSNMFQLSKNSGDAQIGAPSEDRMGAILPGSLEMSNVDLSEEFTEMIITQRGFMASARIITTSDEMLSELVNLKR
ncbi:MAG: flagellar hook protein FlgE [Syntrophomonadaceae bacterium]|nr:flagellar hook protein FlgE [Syntrophomonadaceae bacterium]